MKGVKGWLIAIVLLWIAGALELATAYRVSFAGASPDFPLVILVCLSLFADRRSGAIIGFLAGVIHGSVAGGHLAAYTITRSIVGFLVGWLSGLEYEGNSLVALAVAAFATVAVQLTFLLLSPKGAILPFLLATIGSAMYNGVLAIPIYALLKKVLDSPKH